MVDSETGTAMVKKEVLFIAILVALVAGFIGGVIFSSYRNPTPVARQGSPAATAEGQGQITEAQINKISQLEQEVAKNPGNSQAWTALGNVYYDTGQFAKSINAYNKSLTINPQQADVWSDLGVMYHRDKQPEEAVKAFDHCLSLRPDSEEALFNKGVVLIYDLNKKAEGIKAWQKIVDNNPEARAPNGELLKDVIKANE